MDWELAKENFQPLKAGRDPTQLVKKAPDAPAKEDAAAEERRRYGNQPGAAPLGSDLATTGSITKVQSPLARRLFWREIADYDGDDPLEVWLR